MRYIVSEGAIGPKGRAVRCANCAHQWFESGEQGLDEALFDEESSMSSNYVENRGNFADDGEPSRMEIDLVGDGAEQDFEAILRKEMEDSPIPEGVRPITEDYDPVLAQLGPQKGADPKLPSGAKLGGFMTAALVWIFILAGLLFAHPYISRKFPASNMIYNLVGMKPVMPGAGLALDGLHAAIADGKIALKGNVINLRETDTKVPAVMATIVDADEKPIDHILIAAPVARLKPEGQASFDVVYPKIPDGAANVTFAFSFIKVETPKTEAAPSETPAQETRAALTDEAPHAPEPEHPSVPEPHAPEYH